MDQPHRIIFRSNDEPQSSSYLPTALDSKRLHNTKTACLLKTSSCIQPPTTISKQLSTTNPPNNSDHVEPAFVERSNLPTVKVHPRKRKVYIPPLTTIYNNKFISFSLAYSPDVTFKAFSGTMNGMKKIRFSDQERHDIDS
jgi:hypothetical protein